MRRFAALFLTACLVFVSMTAFAQKKPAGKEAPKQKAAMIEEVYKGTKYALIPYEVVYPESHAQLQSMFTDKFQFFYVVIDNRNGKDPVTFDPKSGDVTLLTKKGGRIVAINLTNTLTDPSQAAKISKAFKDSYVPIQVPPGETKYTILVFGLFNIGDLRSAMWSFPGEMPKEMKGKVLRTSDVKRYKLEPVGAESKESKEKKKEK